MTHHTTSPAWIGDDDHQQLRHAETGRVYAEVWHDGHGKYGGTLFLTFREAARLFTLRPLLRALWYALRTRSSGVTWWRECWPDGIRYQARATGTYVFLVFDYRSMAQATAYIDACLTQIIHAAASTGR